VPCESKDKNHVDIAFLDAYATRRWETILHFLVGTEMPEEPGDGVLELLKQSKLMEGDPARPRSMRITHFGFAFLLQDINAQLWTLLLQYLEHSTSLNMDPVDVLHFLFMLGSLELGQDYSTSRLTDTQLVMLQDDLRDYGLVFQRKVHPAFHSFLTREAKSRRFYPTRLATSLTSGTAALLSNLNPSPSMNPTATTSQGFIVLETNYRLYAYTNSPLQIAILNLFVSLKSRFENLVQGVITRDSVRNALSNGISADQIIYFLASNAHLQMRTNVPVPNLPGSLFVIFW
jgi:transcription initiation factor TFIIH subunit 4